VSLEQLARTPIHITLSACKSNDARNEFDYIEEGREEDNGVHI